MTKEWTGKQNWTFSESHSVLSDSLRSYGLYSPWNSPGQNTGVGSLSRLQRIFPTQGSSPGLPHCRQILYQLSHKGSPKILEWVAWSFSRGSSQSRNRTRVSCIAGGSFINWAPREAQANHKNSASWVKSVANYYLTTRLLKYERDPCGPSLKYIWAEAT